MEPSVIDSNIALSNGIGLTQLAPNIDLRGKTVLVTGGAVGIGRKLVEGALRFGAAKVVVVDIRDDGLVELKKEFGDRVDTVTFDMGERAPEKVADFTAKLRAALSEKLDVVFSNVGVVKLSDITKTKTLAATPMDEMDRLFQINASSNHLLYQAVGDLLKQSDSPRYIATTSPIVGRADPATSGYAISKGAQEAWLQNLMAEMKGVSGLIVAAVDPGRVQTFLRRDIYAGEPLYAQPMPEDIVEPFLRAASGSADPSLNGKVLITQNSVAGSVEVGGKSYKVSGRTEHGFETSLAERTINGVGAEATVMIPAIDTWAGRQLMGAQPVPPMELQSDLQQNFPAPGAGLPTHDGSAQTPFIVLHDRDNNLVGEDITFQAYRKLLANKGVIVPLQDLTSAWVGKRYEAALKSLEEQHGVILGDEAIADASQRHRAAYEDAVVSVQKRHQKTLPGVVGTLAILKQAGVPQGIVTNNSYKVCANGNKVAGIDCSIPDTAICSGDLIWQQYPDATLEELTGGQKGFKPAPDLYNLSLQQNHAQPQNAIAIEDSLSGMKAAKAAGIPTIVANLAIMQQEGKSEAEIAAYTERAREAGATDIITHYAELLPIVAEKAPPETGAAIKMVIGHINGSQELSAEKCKRAVHVVERNKGNVPQRGIPLAG